MISEVVMPQMGADMVEGTLLRWIKHEGDAVERGEIIAEIETDKANVEIEAYESGVFRKTLAAEGDVIAVGGVIAVIAGADDDVSQYVAGSGRAQPTTTPAPAPAVNAPSTGEVVQPRPPAETAAAKATPPSERPAVPTPPPDVHRPEESETPEPTTAAPSPAQAPEARRGEGARLRVSPVARRMAEERGIDVRTLRGSGPDGRIIRRDVEAGTAAAKAPAAGPSGAATAGAPAGAPSMSAAAASGPIVQSKMRQAIARRMSQSKREAPHYYLLIDVDMTDAAAFRAQLNGTLGDNAHVSINDLLVRACVIALASFPDFNVTIAGDAIRRQAERNICIAIAMDDGLIAPAIVGAGTMTLQEIAVAARDLVERAKGGRLRPAELNDGTFTITNLGAYGVETLIGIIQPPQTAILGVGSVMDAAAVHEGAVAVRKVMKVALSADHRTTDGAYGARFLAEIKRLLEHPLLLIL